MLLAELALYSKMYKKTDKNCFKSNINRRNWHALTLLFVWVKLQQKHSDSDRTILHRETKPSTVKIQ